MSPSAPSHAAIFFDKPSFGGGKYQYKTGDDITFEYPEDLNDKFKSCVVGAEAKVLAWQHSNSSGIYTEYTGENPSLDAIDGLSRFKVIEVETAVISFRFDDATNSPARKWSLTVNLASVGNVTLLSNDKHDGDDADGFRLVGTMPKDGPPVTTAVYVRSMTTGEYIANGSIFFQWKAGKVEIVENDNFPDVLDVERKDNNKFILTLTKTSSD